MTANGLLQIALFCTIILFIARPLGGHMTRVFNGDRVWLTPVLRPVERLFYRLAGVDERVDQHWLRYGAAMLTFSVAGFFLLYAILRFQAYLPWNPQGFGNIEPLLAFNTAISFVTNTNWQNYGGESTMSYFTQMVGLTVHNFVSAATGISLAIAFIRGFARSSANGIGNFWVDLTRTTLYVLLPVSIVVGLFFIWQGMPQTLGGNVDATTLEGAHQSIAVGPVASQEVIKMFGTNGGGFFNANSAHPFENPTALTNLIQIVLIFSIGAALTNVFGRMVGNERQGWALFGTMSILFLAGALIVYHFEAVGNPNITRLGIEQATSVLQAGGNMEGKDVRFGIVNSALFAVVTTDASCGAVNSWHDSFTPLGGLVLLVNMQLGEIIFGGVGSGLYGMLLFAIVGVFICGLMVGRTPEYVGKKIEAFDIKMTALAIICLPFSVLGFTALATALPGAVASIANQGPHGFSEILYAFSSATGNNGSAFGGLTGNTPFYNITLGLAMIIGRFAVIVPMLAIAGSLARKRKVAVSVGTFPTDGALWVGILVAVILVVGGLTFFPALSLGPIVEHFSMLNGTLY